MSFSTITEATTQSLQQRVQGSWFNTDGTPKKNYIWKQSDNTPKGDGGERIVADTLEHVFVQHYGTDFVVDVNVVGAEKGDYDVIIEVYDSEGTTVNTLKIEVKTATEDSNKKFQWNGLKKNIDYDVVFGLGVRPDDFVFAIQPREYIEKTLTTNMSRDVVGSFKWTSKERDNVQVLTEENLTRRVEELGLLSTV
tara:strand:+ start:111 stop:695 length:585 start_codon:yes stop_codon:yes gene_type:complete